MNYQMLKTLLDSLVMNYVCPNCQGKVKENNIEIVGAAGTSMNLDILCPSCEKHTFVKTEVSQVNLGNIINLKPENIEKLKDELYEKLSNINNNDFGGIKTIETKINDKEILEVRKILKNENIKVEDFFKK